MVFSKKISQKKKKNHNYRREVSLKVVGKARCHRFRLLKTPNTHITLLRKQRSKINRFETLFIRPLS